MKENFNVKNENGSITMFVLIGLLFMVGILIISYGTVVNNSKIVKEQSNIISQIYMQNEDINESYNEIYSDLRKKNKKTLRKSIEDSNKIEVSNAYAGKINDYKIYGSESGVGDVNLFPIDASSAFMNISDSSCIQIDDDGWMTIQYDNTEGEATEYINFWPKYSPYIVKNANYTFIIETQEVENVGRIVLTAEVTNAQINSQFSQITNLSSNSIYYKTLTSTSNEYTEGDYLCRSYLPIDAGKNVSCKIRISLVNGEITTDNWTGYIEAGKCKIPIRITDEDNNSKIYNIYISSPLYENDYMDFENGKIVRSDGTEENISLPELYTFEDYTKIEILTGNAPEEMIIEYTGYTLK